MEEKRKKERRETRVKVIGFGALAVCYLAMALWNCWDKRAGLMTLSLLREKRLVNGTSIYPLLGEGIDDLFSHNEQIRIWVLSPDTGHSTCVWKGMAWMMPTEVRRLPLLRFTASCPETAEDAGYLEIETELPAGWKLREEGAAPRRGLWEAAVKYRRDREAAERLVCPHCGGRAHHTVGGKEFCSLCLEEMRRE